MKVFVMLSAATLLLLAHPAAFALDPSLWRQWSPRSEIAPRFSVEKNGDRTGQGPALEIQTTTETEFGAWQHDFDQVEPGHNYRFTAWYRATNIPEERRSVIARLEWRNSKGNPVRPPEYALDVARSGDWTRVELSTPAPTNAASVNVQLSVAFAPNATLWWDDVQLTPIPSPTLRTVKAATIFARPRNTKSAAESVEEFCKIAAQTKPHRPDIICLPEGITVVGTGKNYADVSEPIPGPTTDRLGQFARDLGSYVVAGIYEREGIAVYNTAVLIARDGKIVGTYRKTHLPREEWEGGITPGNEYPVFDTDFGKVGLIICWDVQFPEPARAMALKGAEILLLPIWGGSEVLARARAIENHVFLVSSSYDMKTFIVDPAGEVLAEANSDSPIALAELQLDAKIFQPWLGDMKNRTWKERRGWLED